MKELFTHEQTLEQLEEQKALTVRLPLPPSSFPHRPFHVAAA